MLGLWDVIQASLPIDHPTHLYNFPRHITPNNLRPDIVWWSDCQRELWLFELTISYESHVADARERKRVKYKNLVDAGKAAGYKTELLTVEVGSRGMLGIQDLEPLATAISCSHRNIATL